jgi:hypothetical protein
MKKVLSKSKVKPKVSKPKVLKKSDAVPISVALMSVLSGKCPKCGSRSVGCTLSTGVFDCAKCKHEWRLKR